MLSNKSYHRNNVVFFLIVENNQKSNDHCLGNQDGTKIKRWDEEAGQGWREKG
jgi:hypothetical protein